LRGCREPSSGLYWAAIGVENGCITQFLEYAATLARVGRRVIDGDELIEFVRRAVEVRRDAHCPRAVAWLARLADESLLVTERVYDVPWGAVLDLTRTPSADAARPLVKLGARVLRVLPGAIDLFREKGIVDLALAGMTRGTVKNTVCTARFLAVLTDGQFFGSERDGFTRNRVFEEWTGLLVSEAPDADKNTIVVGFCNVAEYINRPGSPDGGTLVQAFCEA